MRLFAIAAIAAAMLAAPAGTASAGFQRRNEYRAWCFDEKKPLSNWLASEDDAKKIGKDHERETKGHRFDIRTREVGSN